MENMGIEKMVEVLRELNPDTEFEIKEGIIVAYIAFDEECSNLILPEGYYLSEKNGLTNKHNTDSGQYECFELMSFLDYL